jgi:6,7-dimethyl-8-ribityllumazine synthase
MEKLDRKQAAREEPVPGARILLVEARFQPEISDLLVAGARSRLAAAKVEVEHIRVPGALEIPLAAAIVLDAAAKTTKPFDGVVALGCVIRGETFHFEIVAGESARGLMQLGVSRGVAIGNGILTVDNEAQALARARPEEGDKGGEAASAALALVRLARARVTS